MLALSEVVALPLLIILFFRWAAIETGRDARQPVPPAPRVAPKGVQPPPLDRPWWETESFGRRTDEFRPRPRRPR